MSFKKIFNVNILCLLVGVVGIFLRLKLYLENRSFWQDEAYVALDISVRTFKDIISLKPFASDLIFPSVGFAFFQKLIITLFGNCEYTFRFLPLICGIVSIYLVFRILKLFKINEVFLPIALILISFNVQLVGYSVELKHHIIELFISLFLYVYYFKDDDIFSDEKKVKKWIVMSISCILFSFASLFILVSIALVEFIYSIIDKDPNRRKNVVFSNYFWILVFLVLFFKYYKFMYSGNNVKDAAAVIFNYNSFNLILIAKLAWNNIDKFINNFIGFGPSLFYVLLSMIGSIIIFNENKKKFFVLLGPFTIGLILFAVRLYPFSDRFLLFLIPMFYLFFWRGIVFICKFRFVKEGIFIILILLSVQLLFANKAAYKNAFFVKSEFRTLFSEFLNSANKDDILIINRASMLPLGYYKAILGDVDEFNAVTVLSNKVFYYNNKMYVLMADSSISVNKEGFMIDNDFITPMERVFNFDKIIARKDRIWILMTQISNEVNLFLDSHLSHDYLIREINGDKLYFIGENNG